MSASIFRDDEMGFFAWLNQFPEGYVVNTESRPSPQTFVLHRSSCTTLHRDVPAGGYTERNYVKACTSDSTPESLQLWVQQVGGGGFTKVCAVCKPLGNAPKVADKEESPAVFEQQVAIARKLTPSERALHLPASDAPPAFYTSKTIVFARNPYVTAEVLDRAKGTCDGCGSPAPFARASDGSPYLEVHHVRRLADGGHDSVENAIALCPNCHRQAHFGVSESPEDVDH